MVSFPVQAAKNGIRMETGEVHIISAEEEFSESSEVFRDRAVADVSITTDTGSRGILRAAIISRDILREIIISKITLSKAALSSRFRKILKVPPFARSAAVQYLPDQSFAFPAAPRLRAQHFAQDAEGLCRPAQSSVRNAVHRRIDDDQKADRCIHRGVTSRRRTLRCLLFGERQRRTAGRAKKVSAAYVEEKSGR